MGRPKTIFKFDNVPQSWDEINLETYQKIHDAYTEDGNASSTKILSIILDKDEEEVKQLPATVVTNVFSRLKFLQEKIDETPNNEIEVDGEIYKINTERELKFLEFVDFNTTLDDNPHNYAYMLAILCRKDDEIYDDDFIANKIEERYNMFLKQPITKIIHLISFFLISYQISKKNTENFMNQMVEHGNLILNNLESSLKSGGGKRPSMKLLKQVETLRKRLNSI